MFATPTLGGNLRYRGFRGVDIQCPASPRAEAAHSFAGARREEGREQLPLLVGKFVSFHAYLEAQKQLRDSSDRT